MSVDDRKSDAVEGWGRDFFFRRGWRYALTAGIFFFATAVVLAWKREWDVAVLAGLIAAANLASGTRGRRR